jgi:hypothetical protein
MGYKRMSGVVPKSCGFLIPVADAIEAKRRNRSGETILHTAMAPLRTSLGSNSEPAKV